MSMNLPNADEQYSQTNEAQTRAALERADAQNQKNSANLEVGSRRSLILTAPNGSRWAVGVNNAGTLTTTAL